LVKLRVKVGPKGQIVIPKILREAYGIREGGYAILEPEEDGIKIRSITPPEEVVRWLHERRARLKARMARLGELGGFDLEEEFEP